MGDLSGAERLGWLRLIRSENVGPITFRNLLRHFGSAAAALDALPGLAKRGGAARAIRVCPRDEADREMEAAADFGVTFVASCEDSYPSRLAAIDDAPPLIAARGNVAVLRRPMIALVGARNASAAGLKFAERLARELGEAGFVIASGLARGVDAAAHRASLATGTVAVLAGVQDRVYPEENIGLLDALLGDGAAVSEMPFGWTPRAQDFPRRNRIISGLSLGVVIVEAAKRSGSLITARFALEQGREVFAVPGSPLDPRARGCNDLLRQGATLTESAADVLAVIRPERLAARTRHVPDHPEPPPPPLATSPEDNDRVRRSVAETLSPTPVAVDEIIRTCQLSAALVSTILLEWELAGRLERHPGNRVSRIG